MTAPLRRLHWITWGVTVLLLVGGVAAAQPLATHELTQIGKRYDYQEELSMQPLDKRTGSVSHPSSEDPVRYMRVQVRLRQGARGRWYLTVRDADLRPVEVLTPESFADSPTRWTGRIPGSTVYFDLDPADDSTDTLATKITLDEYIGMPEKAKISYYSRQGPQATYRELYKDPDVRKRRLGDAVGFLMGSYAPKSWCCSGAVVGQNLFLTNWHCGGVDGMPPASFWSKTVCQDTLIDLSWDGDALSREFQCLDVLAKDQERDFALLRIGSLRAGTAARPLRVRETPPRPAEPLTLIHHPECKIKQITDDSNCQVVDASYPSWMSGRAGVDLTHRCDTEEGSSGGAVLDGQGRLIGLHHLGFAQSQDVVARRDKKNAAVRLEEVRTFLKGCRTPSDSCRPGLDALIQVEP